MSHLRPILLRALLALSMIVCLAGCDKNKKSDDGAPTTTGEVATASGAATSGEATESGDEDAPKQKVGWLWKVQAPEGAAGPTYLYGTMHVAIDARSELHPMVWKKLEEIDRYVMEVDLNSVDPQKILGKAMLPKGQTLRKKMGDKAYKKLEELAPATMAMTMNRMRPWIVLVQLQATVWPTTGSMMDQEMRAYAEKHGAKVAFLEKPGPVIAKFAELYTAEDLAEFLDEFDEFKKQVDDMVRYYREGEVDEIEAELLDPEEIEEDAEEMEVLLFGRNEEWMPKLVGHIERGDVFVAVGLAHLLGDRGLVTSLRKKGYEVERLLPPPADDASESEEGAANEDVEEDAPAEEEAAAAE
jgi:hypothetical protein